jgi:hypothetical protein
MVNHKAARRNPAKRIIPGIPVRAVVFAMDVDCDRH